MTEPETCSQQKESLSPAKIHLSFVVMSLCFSLLHACVTTVLALASTELGPTLGGISSGILYLAFTLTALFGATALVAQLGQKAALVFGTMAYCVYVASFLVSLLWSSFQWVAVVAGSLIGGVAAGSLWTAQGGYMTSAVQAYVISQQVSSTSESQAPPGGGGGHTDTTQHPLLGDEGSEERRLQQMKELASSKFAGEFSLIYLASELSLKIASWAMLQMVDGQVICFTAFTLVALLSTCGMLFIRDIEADLAASQKRNDHASTAQVSLLSKASEAVSLLQSDGKMILMYPLQMAFGFTSSFINYYVTKNIINHYFSEATIPLLMSVISGSAAVLSLPAAWAAGRLGKLPVVTLGIACFIIVTLVFLLETPDRLGHWSIMVPLFIIYGYGRCTFEGQNKAVMADFFPTHGPAWGANVIIALGCSSTFGFFVFPFMTKTQMAILCVMFSCFALVCYCIANSMNVRRTYSRETVSLCNESN